MRFSRRNAVGRLLFCSRQSLFKRLNIDDIDQIAELRSPLDVDDILRVQQDHTPVFVFLIDADTDHGRYLRLDTAETPNQSAQQQTLRFLVENTIDKEGIEKLVAALEQSEKAAAQRSITKGMVSR